MKRNVNLNNKIVLVTGVAGFIGSFLVQKLLKNTDGSVIVGVDSITDYNPIDLKMWRLNHIEQVAKRSRSKWTFIKGDISDESFIKELFSRYRFSIVVNLAAQAGVRYSLDNPLVYIKTNIWGFFNILEACRLDNNLEHLVFASSSSVYGNSEKIPFSTEDKTDSPVSLYAATKKSDEALAYSYSSLYQIPITGLRFFTVYGPAGRTDMFYYKAADRIINGRKIQMYNYGKCKRDFTFVDDIIEGVFRVMKGAPHIDSVVSPYEPPYSLYNIGGGNPENLLDFVRVLYNELVRADMIDKGIDMDSYLEFLPMQKGDVEITYADSSSLEKDYLFKPCIEIKEGLRCFVDWYKAYNHL